MTAPEPSKSVVEGQREAEPDGVKNAAGEGGPAKAEDIKLPFFPSYMRILSYGTGNYGWLVMVVGLGCAMGSGVALPLMNIIFGDITKDFSEYFVAGSGVTESEFKAAVNKNSLFIVYLFIGKFVLTYVFTISFRIISLKASSTIRLEYMQALFAQPVSRLDEISVGSVTNTITGLSNTLQESMSDRLATLFQSIAIIIAAYAIAFKYSWALTLVVSSAILFMGLCMSVAAPILIKGNRAIELADEKHAAIAADVFSSIRTVFSLGAQTSLARRYGEWAEEARKRGTKLAPVMGVHLGLVFFSMYTSFALAFWFGLKLYREGKIPDVGVVITVFFSVLIVTTVMGGILSPVMVITKAVSASGSFFSIIDSERKPVDGMRVASRSDIVFSDVTFAYPTRPEVSVLKSFSVCFQRGKVTALVGPSGSGKSTIVALLERWYDLKIHSASDEKEKGDAGPTATGSIDVNGHNINELDLKWWRTQIGLVQQEPFLFHDTVYNNVCFGLIGSEWDGESEQVKRKLVVEACKEAFADEFVQRLPLGYETIVGEGGITLSGGQRQRLAIARAIVSQPTILVLDEATSAIDVRGEKIVQAALGHVSKDRTTITIAHRLSTVRNADHIVVIKDGTKCEEGTHDQLLSMSGVYYDLVHAQQLEPLTEANNPITGEEMSSQVYDSMALQDTKPVSNSEQTTETKAKKVRSFRTFGVLMYEQRKYSWLYSIVLVAAGAGGAGYAIQSYLFAKLVEAFQFTGKQLADAANFWALMFFILALCVMAVYFTLGFSSTTFSSFVAAVYRKDYFQSLLRQPIPFFDQDANASGSLGGRLSSDVRQLQELFGTNGIFPLISIFTVVGCVAVSFAFGWKLAAVTFFAALPFIFGAAYIRIRYELEFEELNAKVYAESSKFAAEAIRAFRTVSALTMEGHILQKYSDLLAEQRQRALRKAWFAALVISLSSTVDFCAMALTFWYGGQLLVTKEYDLVAFFVVYIAIIQGGQTAGQFFSFAPNIAQAMASANRILQMRTFNERTTTSRKEIQIPESADIQFKEVSFSYASRDTPVFSDLNLTVQSGQFAALVGPSGCGKSTVASLLERFYEPTQGKILFGHTPIDAMDLSLYRKSLSLVAQESKLFSGTIRENLLLGIEDDTSTGVVDDRMIQAAKDAEIHEFINSLPDGYSTQLGANAQTSLSGGQKQRLCIARALLRSPRLLILDEATSSLDSQSEKLIQQAIERLAGKGELTILAIAHRLATIQKADVIFVFGEGAPGKGSRIVERGTHHELLRNRGAYWQMCQAQALDR